MIYGTRLYVGIDLDNTVLSYDKLLRKLAIEMDYADQACPKRPKDIRLALRTYANNEIEGEKRWQKLQDMVYNTRIDDAEIDPYFKAAVAAIRDLGGTVALITQKEENLELPPSQQLRDKVMETLRKRKFFEHEGYDLKEENVHFCRTFGEKIAKIRELRLETYIDDRAEIFEHPLFPKRTFGIRLGEAIPKVFSVQSWPEITAAITAYGSLFYWPSAVTSLEGDNYCHFVAVDTPKERFIYKQYPDHEFEDWNGISFLEKAFLQATTYNKIKGTLRYVGDTTPGIFLECHKTRKVDQQTPGFLEATRQFLIDLCGLEYRYSSSDLISSPEARTILKNNLVVFHHYQRILENTFDTIGKDHPLFELYRQACDHLRFDFTPLATKAVTQFHDRFIALGYDKQKDTRLDNKLHYLSPSNLSRSSCLINEETGQFMFTDFENAGWDDPAKFVCDLRYNPQMDLSSDEREYLIKELVAHRVLRDPKLPERIKLLEPTVRLEWMRFPLESFLPKRLKKLCQRNQQTEAEVLEQALAEFRRLHQQFVASKA